MKIIHARNPHDALPKALYILKTQGKIKHSRNGPVITVSYPVITEYSRPLERVVFWPEREANPFFHLYESLWMLAGRNDLKPLVKFARNMERYSDDGETLHDAYGHRWRYWFSMDQLEIIIGKLKKDPSDRRCVLTMWDPMIDLDRSGKAVPCNLIATFQIVDEKLDLNIFCRSNDIIWGTYGTNCFHFSVLLEYMALEIGCCVGIMRQISINWHAYLDTYETLKSLHKQSLLSYNNPYQHLVAVQPMPYNPEFKKIIDKLLHDVDTGFYEERFYYDPWIQTANIVLRAHHIWKTKAAPERYLESLRMLARGNSRTDIIRASIEWIERRHSSWERKMRGKS
jgi:hypothetical protein